jgi:hypothetical protein
MDQELHSVSSLARKLNRDARTLRKALSRVKREGGSPQQPRYSVATARRALRQHGELSNRISSRQVTSGHPDVAAIEEAASAVQAWLDDIGNEPDIEKRRRIVLGPQARSLGALVDAIEGSLDPEELELIRPWIFENIIKAPLDWALSKSRVWIK